MKTGWIELRKTSEKHTGNTKTFFQFKTSAGNWLDNYKVEWIIDGVRQYKGFHRQVEQAKAFYQALDISTKPEDIEWSMVLPDEH